MNPMETITVNGESYEVTDKQSRDDIAGLENKASIDDSVISTDKTWSSQNIIVQTADRLAPIFHEKAPAVQGELVSDYPLGVVSHITPIQDGEGDPSPENVRNIRGWTALNLTKSGSNFFDSSKLNSVTSQGVTIKNNGDGSFTVNGTATGYPNTKYDMLLPHGKYYVGSDIPQPSGLTFRLRVYTTESSYNDYQVGETAIIDESTLRASAFIQVNEPAKVDNVTFKPYICFSSDCGYTPFTRKTYNRKFSSEIYGGVFDWKSGILSNTWKIKTFTNENDFTVMPTDKAENSRYTASLPGAKVSDTTHSVAYCSFLSLGGNGETWGKSGIFAINKYKLYIRPVDGMKSLDDLKKYLPFTVAYQVESPTYETLTPEVVTALQDGITAFFSDTGDTEVTGREVPYSTHNALQAQIEELKKAILSLGGNI